MDEINDVRNKNKIAHVLGQIIRPKEIKAQEISSDPSDEFTEMAIDCPVSSSVMTSNLITNDTSEFLTACMSDYPSTVEQQQQQQQQEQFQTMPTNISYFFASDSYESDLTNLFRMKKSSIDSNAHACMCGHDKFNILSNIVNANSSKKRTINVTEIFRRIKSSFASSKASSKR